MSVLHLDDYCCSEWVSLITEHLSEVDWTGLEWNGMDSQKYNKFINCRTVDSRGQSHLSHGTVG